jgi:hypothetical protein
MEYLPAAQAIHDDVLGLVEYVPAEHDVQEDEPVVVE